MGRSALSRLILTLLLLFWLATLLTSKVGAHGFGKQELMQVEAGPYLVSAWVDPRTITTDATAHVSVSVQWQDDIYSNAEVQVVFKHREGKTATITQTAKHASPTDILFYETQFKPPVEGKYDVTVIVDAVEAGHGEATFDMDVEAGEKSFLQRWAGWAIAAVVMVGFLFWMFKRTKEA